MNDDRNNRPFWDPDGWPYIIVGGAIIYGSIGLLYWMLMGGV